MGLDNYLMRRATLVSENPNHGVIGHRSEELHYWRKQYALHEWMRNLYLNKGGTLEDEGFNHVDIILTNEDLDLLEEAVIAGELKKPPHYLDKEAVSIFLSFHSNYKTGQMPEDMAKALKEARSAIQKGYTVYYYSCL